MKKETCYLSRKRRGFTLAELLIVVAIIAVLVAIAIPLFTSQLEKSREATDLANARSFYAEVMAEAIQGNYKKEITFDLKQKVYDWQTADGKVTIAGFTPADTANWIGVPGANGKCTVSYKEETGAIFNWSGDGSSSSYNFNMNENFFTALDNSKKADGLGTTGCFVFDSNTTSTTYVPAIKEQLTENSLLQKGTWAYAGAKGNKQQQYLIWTSFEMKDTTKWANQTVPVIVQDRSGGYYVSESKTAVRQNNSGNYIAISAYKGNIEDVQNYASMASGTRYSSLKDAYAAYQKALSSGKYDNLPKSE